MEMDIEAPTTDVIAMNLTMAALEQWLKNVSAERNGEDLGREIGALYREIHSAVDEMTSSEEPDEDEDEEEEEEEEHEDERD